VFLVDTSAWIEVFRKEPSFDLASIGGVGEVVTCLPVIQEVLQGLRKERAFRIARESMFALQIVEAPLPAQRYEEAAHLYRSARRAGITLR